MKRLGIFILMLMSLTLAVSASSKKEGKIKFETTTHDFGTIQEKDGPVTVDFKFTNEGDAPLQITSARAECGCTRPEYPRGEIAPGESGHIRVTFNPLGREEGGFTKVVTVKCTGNPGKINLKIRGTIAKK